MAGPTKPSQKLIEEIERALANITYGSIELYVQDKIVTQITVRSIKKTSVKVQDAEDQNIEFANEQEQANGVKHVIRTLKYVRAETMQKNNNREKRSENKIEVLTIKK